MDYYLIRGPEIDRRIEKHEAGVWCSRRDVESAIGNARREALETVIARLDSAGLTDARDFVQSMADEHRGDAAKERGDG